MPKTSQLNSFDEADAALRILGEAQRDLAQLELNCQAKIDAAKARLAEARIGLDAVVKSTTKLLTQFIQRHQAEIEASGGKTVRLTFGRIGLRTPPESVKRDKGFTEEDCIVWLRHHFPKKADAFIRPGTEHLRLDDLKLWDEADLAKLGLHIEQEDVVVIEPAADVPAEVVA